ncbi:PQQ-dependent sugar dehydrogenase [Paenibacillus arenilitoris]|uniref:Sorbosone dehydrogenase family protein n=1 Tax=Paenibacillus arenilitoris TaxID=2772299 RepID=A0A927H890_9BACL|nr:sorbosone dehydrogenase family protein [Paenibacillus arenilitoris]MBD2872476.1 sorbosone dehydrogenase family protein [Paenibacillus arenilitoris]
MLNTIKLSIFIAAMVFISGCSSDDQRNSISEQPSSSDTQIINEQADKAVSTGEPEIVADQLKMPWSIEKSGNVLYVTEMEGTILKIEDGAAERQVVELEHELMTTGRGGLLGLELAPDFTDSNLAYAYYSYESNNGQFYRIVRLRLEGNSWKEEQILLDDIPSGMYHHGGRVKIGPDGKLYATVGDIYVAEIAQDLNLLGGKILRMNPDGSIPDDNPFPDSYIFSYGHRNPQGIAWSTDGSLYESEHGNNANDEINLIEAGQNYGWPIIEGNEVQEGMVSPQFTSGSDETWAPSGIAYSNGKLYAAALSGSAVIEFDLNSGERREIVNGLGRIRDVLVENDILYFISSNTDGRGTPQTDDDKLYRISLTESK